MADQARAIDIKPVEFSGEPIHFNACRAQIESRAVGLLCVHGTILDDVERANYNAGNAASRRRKQEILWALLTATFSPFNSTWADEFKVTNTNEPGTVFWKHIVAWYSRSQTHTEEMI